MHALVIVLGFLLTPVAVATGNMIYKAGRLDDPPRALEVDHGHPLPEHDASKGTAVVLFSLRATEVTDALPPFAVLAETGAFNTYAVAPERRPVPIYNAQQRPAGVHLLPHLGFAEYEQIVGGYPDVLVIPYFPGFAPGTDDAILEWIRGHIGPETRVVTVCAGTEIFAASGLLDGRAATTNPYWLGRLRERHPRVRWIPDRRYVADGPVFTSTSLTSGIDATLAAVADELGSEASRAVGRSLSYRHLRYLDDPREPWPVFSAVALPDVALARARGPVPVVIAEGFDEIGLSAVLEIEPAPLRQTRVLASAPGVVSSLRGLDVWVSHDLDAVHRFERAVWLGGPSLVPPEHLVHWAHGHGGELESPLREGVFPYDAIIADVGLRRGRRLAISAAANLAYPTEPAPPGRGGWPAGWWWLLAWGVLGAAISAAALSSSTRTAPPSSSTS